MINEEIQVGEYIRTYNGTIFKIIEGNYDNYLIDVDFYDLQKTEDDIYENLMWLNYNDDGNFIRRIAIKHSFNIIDLIEEGDFVNGDEVNMITEIGGEKVVVCDDYDFEASAIIYNNKRIKSIVTHEQFKLMEYKVGN